MKRLALILISGISFATAHAQFQFGLKGGVNFANISDAWGNTSSTQFNVNAGVFFHMPVARRVAIQPELYYSGQGDQFTGGNDHLNYLNLPILLKFSSRTGLYFETGPQFGFLVSANSTYQGVTTDIKSDIASGDFAWVFGLGFKIPLSPVGIDLRYNAGLSNINNAQGDNTVIHNTCWQLGVTYVLFSTGKK